MRIAIINFTLFLFLTSCGQIIPVVYGVNKDKSFKSKDRYTKYATKHTAVDNTRLLYLKDDDLNKFFGSISSRNIDYYYGTFIGDSLEIIKSDSFELNRSCGGRIVPELDSTLNRKTSISNPVFKQVELFHMYDDSKFTFPAAPKKTVFFIYSYKMGSVHKNDFKSVNKFVEKHSDQMELFIISLDPYSKYGD